MNATSEPVDSDTEAPPASDLVLDVAELRAGYGRVPVLHGVTLQVHEGEAIGIVGHNGMGKTTLLKTLVGLLPVSGGRIGLDGVDVTRNAAHQRAQMGIGYVPQGRGILPALSALENLRLAWRASSGETELQAIERVVDQFPRLRELLARRGGTLSGGEQQILALARALVPNPWLLLLDEPSEGVQPSIVQEIGSTLAKMRSEHRLSLLIVEQNLDLVLDVADRVLVLERGRIVSQMPVEDVRAGALADLLGMGSAPVTRTAPTALAVRPAAPTGSAAAAREPEHREHREHRDRAAAATGARLHTRYPAASAHPRAAATVANAPGGNMSTVKRPTVEQLHQIVDSLHMSMSNREVADYLEALEGTFQAYDRLTQLPDNLPAVRYPRTPGTRP
ncbi:MAG: ATP-binding cassette domain-containing protein, partial [Rubrivivax sp.]